MKRYIMGISEAGRAASKRRPLRLARREARTSPKNKYIIGIDEVGRGCLAGPVYVAAVAMPEQYRVLDIRHQDGKILKLKDSKQLSASHREAWFACFKDHPKIRWAVARVGPTVIDRINISRAANRAALAALKRLCHASCITYQDLSFRDYRICLDGGLCLGNSSKQEIHKKGITVSILRKSAWSPSLPVFTIVKGDEKIPAIAAASIMAKVSRDRAMRRLAKKYPHYGLEVHKGYGTKRHYAALQKHGPSEIHRLTFAGKYHRIDSVRW